MKVGGMESLVASRINSVFFQRSLHGGMLGLDSAGESNSVISIVSYRLLQRLQSSAGIEWNVWAETAFFVGSLGSPK